MPGNMTKFRVGKINQPNFYAWAQEGIVQLADRNIPKGTILESETQSVDYPALSRCVLNWSESAMHRQYLSQPVNEALEQRLTKLAHEWVGDRPRGWEQIEAIIQGLRTNYTLDKRALPPVDSRDVVGCFLDSKRGRDVDFATTAVLMLRSLGYPTRLVSGLYVHPDHYDPKTEHYMIYRDDVHFWPEVLIDHKVWVALEPTPGYELATPVYSWFMRFTSFAVSLWEGVIAHPWLVTMLLVIMGMLYWIRHEIVDRVVTYFWRWGRRQILRQEVLRTLRLIDRRATWSGQPRPQNKTPARWYCKRCRSEVCEHALQQLMQMSIWAAYAPTSPNVVMPWAPEAVYSICDEVVHYWSLKRFRRTYTTTSPSITT